VTSGTLCGNAGSLRRTRRTLEKIIDSLYDSILDLLAEGTSINLVKSTYSYLDTKFSTFLQVPEGSSKYRCTCIQIPVPRYLDLGKENFRAGGRAHRSMPGSMLHAHAQAGHRAARFHRSNSKRYRTTYEVLNLVILRVL
jgi:hypothetical protein